jgi:hypothetical protein
MDTKKDDAELSAKIRNLKISANKYFDECISELEKEEYDSFRPIHLSIDHYWDQLSPELKEEGNRILKKFISIGKNIANICNNSTLVDEVDQRELSKDIKAIRAALQLRYHHYNDATVAHDEGKVFGILPPSQDEGATLPSSAKNSFNRKIKNIDRLLQLLDENSLSLTSQQSSLNENISRYKKNTAFLMMWIDKERPELEDVNDTIKDVFRSFDIKATRADDIEHQDVITRKIIEEIKTSEFLIADLTGSRPSVYYEVGYAHAIGKRVILFRKKGTKLHFDLAGYNCPEYSNLRDLREQLSKRLESMTGKKPE